MQYLPAYIEIAIQEGFDQIIPLDVFFRDVSQGTVRFQAFSGERATSPTLSFSTENGYITRGGSVTHPQTNDPGFQIKLLFTALLTQGKARSNAYIFELKHTLNGNPILLAKGLLYINQTLSQNHD